MREPQRREIGGRTYEVAPLPAGKGLAVLTRLAKLLGPSLGSAASVADAARLAGEAFGALADRLDPTELDAVCRALAEVSRVEAQPGSGRLVPLRDCFDVHFAGDFLALFQWAKFALEVSFGPLWGALSAGRAAPAALGASAAAAS